MSNEKDAPATITITIWREVYGFHAETDERRTTVASITAPEAVRELLGDLDADDAARWRRLPVSGGPPVAPPTPLGAEASAGMWKRRAEALASYVLGCDDAVAGGARSIVSGTGSGYHWPDEAPAIPEGYEVREFAPGDLRLVRLRDGASFGMVQFPDLSSAADVGRALASWAEWKKAGGR